MLAAIVAFRMGFMMLDRQMVLPVWTAEIWSHTGNVSDTEVFTVLYVVTPPVWIVLSAWWWLTRPQLRWSLPVAAVLCIGLAVAVPALWGWFVTALWHVERAFDVDGIPRDLIYFGFTDTDYWGVAVVVGLACMLLTVVVDLALMVRRTAT